MAEAKRKIAVCCAMSANARPPQPTILSAGTTWIKYDPNYAAGDDEDEEMGSASDDEGEWSFCRS